MNKILIANRGEIALRIIRTAHAMGIETVAIYSDADAQALHVKRASESIYIGPSPSSQSYLRGTAIIKVAIDTDCDAIHPGYGFLSEDPAFSESVRKAGLLFIGPGPDAIRLMGDKLAAKKLAKEQGVPLLPGSQSPIADIETARILADEIGYPILLKAAAGGGGKGMRIVHVPEEFADSFDRASSEATHSFGNGAVFVEKYLVHPKHIEIQVAADQYGNVLHLFERDCSIQRRHQKVMEEAPGPTMTNELRTKMTEVAIRLTKACHYEGVGTLEFLVDEEQNFFFLEMNTRLQVEHPVTEMVCGLDLVQMQIEIASGKKLEIKQEDLKLKGHSIQLRVYAEDPSAGFIPSIGHLDTYVEPTGHLIRVDGGMEQGQDVPIYYDPLLAKLIVFGTTRVEAMYRLRSAIHDYLISGVATTLSFGSYVLSHPDFITGSYNTGFVEQHYNETSQAQYLSAEMDMAAWIAGTLQQQEDEKLKTIKGSSSWWSARR